MNQSVASIAHADLALAVYLEPLAEGRRVLLLGDAHGTLADRLDTVARRLDIIDPAAREPSEGPVPELPFADGAFDVVLVCDVAALPDPRPDAVRELRRVLAEDGVLAIAAHSGAKKRRRGGPVHVMLDKLLSAELRHVRVLGQAALSGYSLSQIDAARDEEFAVDSSLVRGEREQAERYIGIASDVRLDLEPRLWVQVPVSAPAEEAAVEGPSFELLRRVEDEAREAAQREADAVRELEAERKARAEAEHKAERARMLERRLRDAEADYDDAVARLRYFESELAEREAAGEVDKTRREKLEHELAQAKAEVLNVDARIHAAEAERDAAKAEAEALAKEASEIEKRLVDRGEQILALERDNKQKETVARDLLEELKRLEQHKTAAVEHDARVAELEAERDRAVQRALDAEVAREASQMRVDELRAQLGHAPARAVAEAELEGRLRGLRLRAGELEQELERARRGSREELARLEQALSQATEDRTSLEQALSRANAERASLALRLEDAEAALRATNERLSAEHEPVLARHADARELDIARGERAGLALRLAEAEAALALAQRASKPAAPSVDVEARLATERERQGEVIDRLEARIEQLERQNRELERELEEADRFSEAHAEDAERVDALEDEVEVLRRRLESVEDELRGTEDDLRAARQEAESASVEASARVELAQRRENEARTERDAARAALEEARATLAQLAGGSLPPSVGVAATEVPETD